MPLAARRPRLPGCARGSAPSRPPGREPCAGSPGPERAPAPCPPPPRSHAPGVGLAAPAFALPSPSVPSAPAPPRASCPLLGVVLPPLGVCGFGSARLPSAARPFRSSPGEAAVGLCTWRLTAVPLPQSPPGRPARSPAPRKCSVLGEKEEHGLAAGHELRQWGDRSIRGVTCPRRPGGARACLCRRGFERSLGGNRARGLSFLQREQCFQMGG